LEAYANQCAGYILVGTAAARQLRDASAQGWRLLNCEPFRGAFWQCLCLLVAGGIRLDRAFAARAFEGLYVAQGDDKSPIRDSDCPIPLGLLGSVQGIRPRLAEAARFSLLDQLIDSMAVLTLSGERRPEAVSERNWQFSRERIMRFGGRIRPSLVEEMVEQYLLPESVVREASDLARGLNEMLHQRERVPIEHLVELVDRLLHVASHDPDTSARTEGVLKYLEHRLYEIRAEFRP
jgi:hypothetical protein